MLFYIEVTDTFGGEANYSWVTRHVIRANNERGACNRFSRMSGINWHCTANHGDTKRYDSKSGATCYFIEALPVNYEDLNWSLMFHTLNTDER